MCAARPPRHPARGGHGSLGRRAVLLFAGSEDLYVPCSQLTEQINTLTNSRSITARVFTRSEHAQNHVQTGNIALSVNVMLGWLAELDERDRQLAAPPIEPHP